MIRTLHASIIGNREHLARGIMFYKISLEKFQQKLFSFSIEMREGEVEMNCRKIDYRKMLCHSK